MMSNGAGTAFPIYGFTLELTAVDKLTICAFAITITQSSQLPSIHLLAKKKED